MITGDNRDEYLHPPLVSLVLSKRLDYGSAFSN